MNTKFVNRVSQIPGRLAAAMTGVALLALLFAAKVATAQPLVVDTFADASSVDVGNVPGIDWANYRGLNVTVTWDPNQQSPGNPNPGAMYVTVDWPATNDPSYTTSWTDMQFGFDTSGVFDTSNYIAFQCDIMVDVTNSSLALDGSDYGAIELIVNNSWDNVVGWAQLLNTNGWQHFSGYFSAMGSAQGDHSQAIIGLISQGTDTLTNAVSYWIDNIVFTAPPTANTNQPPIAIATAPPPGLTCICSQPGGTYQRQVIETANSDYSWNTATAASNTTTYSMTIAAFPGPAYTGFEDQMFLIPLAGMTGTPQDDDIDWDSSDVAALYVGVNSDGSATGTFQYKVGQPSSWTTSLVVSTTNVAGPLGTWTIAFNDNTNVTLTAPDKTSTNFVINANDASDFADPLYVYLGDQPNQNANIGQSSTFSGFSVTGAASSFSDNFATFNTNNWANDTASDELGIFVNAPDAKYWLTWPTPDAGFTNVFATDNLTNQIATGQWMSLPSASTGWVLVGGNERLTVINQSTVNAAFGYQPTNVFFELYHN
ncbi:MAG TPA: hypothetical protein VGR14_09570 [Verrucomicrobiae bacterium]|jgi:hypothetical protein|nr:hypothetical protein [Verrucomicrobiae bacterium]